MLYIAGEVLLTLYLYCISYFYTLSVPLSWTSPLRLLIIYVIVHYLCGWLAKIQINVFSEARKKNIKFGLIVFGMTAGILGVYYIAYYPGGLIIDTFNQWYQVQQGFLLDWHPAIHTILFMKIPSLFINSLAFVNFLQIIWAGLAMAYFGMVLESWGIKKFFCIVMLFLGIAVPSSAIVMSFCWKDTALTIFCIVLAAQMTEIVLSDGIWLKRWDHIAEISVVAAFAALMRHNAILFVMPLAGLILLLYWGKIRYYSLLAGIGTVLVIGTIKGPLYKIMNVQNHPQVSAEMLGLPMTILANVLVHEPDKLDSDAKEFLYKIGSQELWEETYKEGSWNSAKWMGEDISNDVIEEEGTRNVLRYTWHAIKNSPYYAYRAVVRLFEVVWKPLGTNVNWSYAVSVGDNIYDYETAGIPVLRRVLDWCREVSIKNNLFMTWCWHIGFYVLLLLFAGVSRLKYDLKKCFLWIPIICYDFGTALLLCGPDFRFFSFNIVITLPLLLAIFAGKDNNEKLLEEVSIS